MSGIDREVEYYERAKVDKRLIKIKDEDLFKAIEEVFDHRTLLNVQKLMRKGIIKELRGAVAQGKEAKVFWGIGPNDEDLAVKIFYVETADFIKGRYKYIEGDPRFEDLRRNPRKLICAWCSKEFRNLKLAYEAGVRVPKPITVLENILVMEFISFGDKRGVPAPLIKDYPPEDIEKAYWTIIDYIRKAYVNGGIVHADLSEYNVLNTGTELVIIDWGSAVKSNHPLAKEFLKRDITNITRFFMKLGLSDVDVEDVYRSILEEAGESEE